MANVWTSYYQCSLHVVNLILRLDRALSTSLKELSSTKRESEKLRREIATHIDDIFAAVPFMLAGDDIRYCKPGGALWQLLKPPKLLGGLSMQWMLFTIAILDSAPAASKWHARDILSWFGETLGIGQAKVLANVRPNFTPL